MSIALKQWTTLEAKTDFKLKPPKTKDPAIKTRAITVSKGQRFQVTNSQTSQLAKGIVLIDREGKGHISIGYPFTPDQILTLFDITP